MDLTIGGTQTGGTLTTLTPAGGTGGRYSFVLPSHTVLNNRTVTFQVKRSGASKTSLGDNTALVDIAFANSTPEEGCCTIVTGGVYTNLKIVYGLTQPETVVDEVLDVLQGVAFATALRDMITKGILPT